MFSYLVSYAIRFLPNLRLHIEGSSALCLASTSIPHFEQRGKDELSGQSLLLFPNSCDLTKIKQERKLTLILMLFRNC